jgi:site-specific recombinase
MAQFVKHHLSGVAGYVCLGLLMGLLPFVSVFAGLPVGSTAHYPGQRVAGL